MLANSKSIVPNSRLLTATSTTSSCHSGASLTTTLQDMLPSETSASSRPSTASVNQQNDLTSVDVELLEREATTIDDAGLSTDDIEARREMQRLIAINDGDLSMQDRWRLSNVLRGAMPFDELARFSQSLHSARSVTLLLLSTFSDFQAERHYLHTEILPDLRDTLRCDAQIDLNVVDIWLGVEDEKSVTPLDWHNFANFLIGQGKTGTPLICVILSGHKYGQPVVAPIFDEEIVNTLTEFCSADSVTSQLLADALWPDIGHQTQDNVVNQERRRYILRQEVLGTGQMHALSYLIASASVKRPELEQLVSSGPELLFDVITANFNPNDVSLVVFNRRIAGLRDNTHLPVCRAYCDSDSDSPADFCHIRLKQFQDKLCRLAPELANRLNLELKINDLNGVNCERHTRFSKHLADCGKLLYHAIKNCEIVRYFQMHSPLACALPSEGGAANRDQTTAGNALDMLIREATVHLMYAHQHASNCVGRDKLVSDILNYITNHETNTTTFCKPLAILGSAGSGQSTLMSCTVLRLIEQAFPGDSSLICIPRFANLTPTSSELKMILRCMLLHLAYVIGGSSRANRELDSSDDIASIKNRFIHELQTLRQSVRVVFVLDGFESLRSGGSAGFGDFIDWLPSVLSERVRVVVCLKREKEETVQHFVARYGDGCILNIENFPPDAANELLKSAFSASGQQLMFSQWQALRKAIDCIAEANGGGVAAPYLALIREAALRWHSFTSVSPNYFGFTVEDELDRIFSLYELRNGTTFTRHTLAYLTAAHHRGLSLGELGDVLALDNFVLHALADGETGTGVSSSETSEIEPPRFALASARIPTLAIYRLLFEVNPFLAQRTVDSLAVIVWADGLLSNFARNRYLDSDPDLARMVNSTLAEYFLGTWAGKTPKDLRLSVCDSSDLPEPRSPHSIFSQGKAVRYVVHQPLGFTDCRTPDAVAANMRRLNCLPHFLLASGRHKDLCLQVLFNLDWMMAKISAMGVDKAIEDFQEAINGVRRSTLISPTGVDEMGVVRDALKFSRSILTIRPYFLPALLSARLLAFQHSARMATLHKNICSLLNQCDRISATERRCSLVPIISSLDTPGSPLIYTAQLTRNSPMTIATSPLHVMPIQTNYAFVLGLKLEASLSARFWAGCGCGSLGPEWFCAPVRNLPAGPFFKLNTPGGRLFAAIADKQILQVYHTESGELVYTVNLLQQVEVKQFVSSDRFIIIVPGLTTVSSINGPVDQQQQDGSNGRPVSASYTMSNNGRKQATVTQPTGPIIIDMLHKAVAHRFSLRPELAAISADNDFFAFSVNEEIFVYQLPLMECVHSFRTDMPPTFIHVIPQSVHGRSDDVRLLVVTNHGSVVLAVVSKKLSKSLLKPALPYRETLISPVVQIDAMRGGVLGLIESPGRLFLLGLRDGSLVEEFQPPTQIPAPRRFTAATFACSDQIIAGALDTGHICLFRIGDSSSTRIINPPPQTVTTPINKQIITHMYGPNCCWRVMALSTNGETTYLRCWDVERLSSLSHIADHSHVVAPGNVLGLFPPTPYVDGLSDATPMAVAMLSSPINNNTQQCCLQVFDLKSRSVAGVPLVDFDWSQRVSRIILSPNAGYCFVVDTNRTGFLYTASDNPYQNHDYSLIANFADISDAFFTSPGPEQGKLFETLFILVINDSIIEVYRLGYGTVELLQKVETREVRDPVFLSERRSLCFLTNEANQNRAKEDIKLAVIYDVCRPEVKTFHLFEIWRVDGNAHWELSHLLPIKDSPNQVMVLFTVAELSATLYPILRRDHVGCFSLDIDTKAMIWSSLGMAAYQPNSPVKAESLFFPIGRLPYLHIDSRAKLACDVDLGTVYDLQLGVRLKVHITTPCCIESFRYLLNGDYFCALSTDRRKVLTCRCSDEQRVAEFELFGIANCLEVVACRDVRSNHRVIVIGMEDGRLVALSFVVDLCDPLYEHLVQFRKSL